MAKLCSPPSTTAWRRARGAVRSGRGSAHLPRGRWRSSLLVPSTSAAVPSAVGDTEEPDAAFSLPLGAGRLTREYLSDDPPGSAEVKHLRKHVRHLIGDQADVLESAADASHIVGTSKTFNSLPGWVVPHRGRPLRAAQPQARAARRVGAYVSSGARWVARYLGWTCASAVGWSDCGRVGHGRSRGSHHQDLPLGSARGRHSASARLDGCLTMARPVAVQRRQWRSRRHRSTPSRLPPHSRSLRDWDTTESRSWCPRTR